MGMCAAQRLSAMRNSLLLKLRACPWTTLPFTTLESPFQMRPLLQNAVILPPLKLNFVFLEEKFTVLSLVPEKSRDRPLRLRHRRRKRRGLALPSVGVSTTDVSSML